MSDTQMQDKKFFRAEDRKVGNIPQPENFPLGSLPIIDRLDAINAELRAMKDSVYGDPRYAKARMPMADAIRNMILVEGYILNVVSPLAIVQPEGK